MSNTCEIHGWVNINYTYENSDRADDLSEINLPNILKSVADKIRSLDFASAEVRLIENYGVYFLTVCGFSWHASDSLKCIKLYEFIASEAKGSYGLLYLINHEEAAVKVFVLKRGNLNIREDKYLSPFVPEVEDYFTE